MLFFISLDDAHLRKKTQTYIHFEKSSLSEEISVGENWGLRKAKTCQMTFSITEESFYIFN